MVEPRNVLRFLSSDTSESDFHFNNYSLITGQNLARQTIV